MHYVELKKTLDHHFGSSFKMSAIPHSVLFWHTHLFHLAFHGPFLATKVSERDETRGNASHIQLLLCFSFDNTKYKKAFHDFILFLLLCLLSILDFVT